MSRKSVVSSLLVAVLAIGVLAACRLNAAADQKGEKAATLAQVRTALKSGKPVFIELSAPW